MKKMPTLKQLQHLITLFDYQHFGKAAKACFISQSTLSASIGHLEEILGIQLLERKHKNFIFTHAGEAIVERSRRIIEAGQDLMDYAKETEKPMHGLLRLGCIPTIAPFMMSQLVTACNKVFPDLKLLIREDTTDNLFHFLEIGQLDIIILSLPYPSQNLHTEILCPDPFQLVLLSNWVDKTQGKGVDQWPDESIFILEKEHCLTAQTLQACALKNSKKINPFFATSLHTLIQMVNSGLGVTFLPQLAINSGILEGTNLATVALSSTACRDIGMVWRTTSHKQRNYQLFAGLVKSVLERIINLS